MSYSSPCVYSVRGARERRLPSAVGIGKELSIIVLGAIPLYIAKMEYRSNMQTSGGYRLNCHMPCASVDDSLWLTPAVPSTCRFNTESNRDHGQHYETGLLVH